MSKWVGFVCSYGRFVSGCDGWLSRVIEGIWGSLVKKKLIGLVVVGVESESESELQSESQSLFWTREFGMQILECKFLAVNLTVTF